MGTKRGWGYDAVIGVGAVQAEEYGFAGKVKWIGITRTWADVGKRGPEVTFEHFRYFEKNLPTVPPRLAARIRRAPRGFMSLTRREQEEADELLELAKHAAPSQAAARTRVEKGGPVSCPTRSLERLHAGSCKRGRAELCD
jgi:hypothetical protein